MRATSYWCQNGDINWFDSYINATLLSELAKQGVNPDAVPVFFVYNTNLAAPVNNLFSCCILGYHSFAGEPTPSQLYSVAEIDVSKFFPPGYENTSVIAHELGELVNDPYGNNEVPHWGHSGQQAACPENREVGDPLTGTDIPKVTMPNGFTYNLQELEAATGAQCSTALRFGAENTRPTAMAVTSSAGLHGRAQVPAADAATSLSSAVFV
jgi:hypothetical protein